MRVIGIGLVTLVGLFAVDVSRAAACVCAGSYSPCGAFALSSVVFIGDVVAVQDVGKDVRMRLRVVRALKGIREATAEVLSDRSGCGVRLTVGHRYLIHTSGADGGRIGHCNFPRRIVPGEPTPELPPIQGRIYGEIARYEPGRIGPSSPPPVAAVRVWLDRPGGRVSATTDAWGRFTLDKVPPGTYEIRVAAGQGMKPLKGTAQVTMTGPEDCASANILLMPPRRLP